MSINSIEHSFCATLMHTPVFGDIEIIKEALIKIDANGVISSVTRPEENGYTEYLQSARQSGRLTMLDAGKFLLPGLVDLHIHAPQWPQLGKTLHLPLYEWLEQKTFPLEARYEDVSFAKTVYDSLVCNLIANGTTTAVYFGTIHREANMALAEICLKYGQRALVGKVAMDDPPQCPEYYRDASAEIAVDQTLELIAFIRELRGNDNGLVSPIITPRFIPSCSDKLLAGLGKVAGSTGCHVQTHCSESDWEHGYVIDRMSKTDTAALDDFGLLTRKTVLAHSNFITSDDCCAIMHAGAGVAHCPLSNFHFANSVFPLRDSLRKGLHVGLGTDIAGGPSASMFDSCRHAITASRALEDGVDSSVLSEERGTPGSRIDFRHAFWLATAGGGEVLDLPIGKFVPGFQFDAIVVDAYSEASNVMIFDEDDASDIFQKIVYGATRTNIFQVWISGKCVDRRD